MTSSATPAYALIMRAVFLGVPAQGHTNPTLPVVAELVRRGDEVLYYSTESFRSAIVRAGASYRRYDGFEAYDDRPMGDNLFRLAATLLQATATALPSLLPALEAHRPDVVVHDSMACWGAYLARLLGIPAVCSVTTFAFNARVVLTDLSRVVGWARDAVDARGDIARFRALGRELERSYGVPAPRFGDVYRNREALNIVYTSQAFQPFGDAFDESFRFVGPSLRDESHAADFPFEALGEAPVLFVSLGTLFNDRPDFYRACFEALGDLDRRVVLSVGRKVDLASLGRSPANFIVRPHVPQLRVLERSALFVTHGGMNSVNEALYFGVPLVAFPQVADQALVARRVEALGAGKLLRGRPDAGTLRRTVDGVLHEPSFRDASERLRASLREAGGYRRAADEIEAFVATRRS